MDLARIPATLAELWDDLPTLVGPQWTDLVPDVEAAVLDLADDAGTDQAVRRLALLFRPYPAVAGRLRDALTPGDRAGDPTEPVDLDRARDRLASRLDAPPTVRYLRVYASHTIRPGDTGVVVAGLARTAGDGGAPAAALRHDQRVRLHLYAVRGDIAVTGEPVQAVDVPPDADSPMRVFQITAATPGPHRLRLDVRQAGLVTATVDIAVQVDAAGPTGLDHLPPTVVTLGGRYVPPPDLDLRVTVHERDGHTVLGYVLHSPNGAANHHYQPAGEVVLAEPPERYRRRLIARIERLAPLEAQERLRVFGERLYREVLPPAVRQAYRSFRHTVRTLQVTSDEPWIPWELVRPYDDEHPDDIVDDDHWAARFDLSRWLAGTAHPAGRITVTRLACLVAPEPPGLPKLPSVTAEHDYLTKLATDCGVEDASPASAGSAAVRALIADPSVRLWHFAGHGNADPEHPDEAVLHLADGSSLRAEDLSGPRQTAVARARPMVFLNACRVATQGWSLSGLGGWVEAWLGRGRAGAFVGPLWSVGDAAAAHFARVLYDRLRAGEPLARAVRAARADIRTRYPTDPTWLAYSLYGNPNGHVVFGAG